MARHRLVLLAVLAFAPTLAAVPARPDESRKYLPGDAEVIASFNLRQLLQSELVANHKDKVETVKGMLNNFLQNREEAKKYFEELGLKPLRDFHTITVAVPASLDPEKGLVIIEGKFNADKFHRTAEQAAKEYGEILKIGRIGSHEVWEVNAPGHDKPLFVTLANASTLLFAHGKNVLTTALDQKESDLKKDVRELLKTTNTRQSMNFVATGKALSNLLEKAAEHNPDPKVKQVADAAAPVLKTIEGFTAAITVGKDIDFQFGIGTRDKNAADVLAKQINGMIVFVRGMVGANANQDPKAQAALEVMKTLQASTQETTVLVRGQVAAAVLEEMMQKAAASGRKLQKRPRQ
jgi:hypothetical protein